MVVGLFRGVPQFCTARKTILPAQDWNPLLANFVFGERKASPGASLSRNETWKRGTRRCIFSVWYNLFIIAELGNKENCNMFYILSSGDMLSNFANGLYPDQVRQYIGRDSNPNCLAFRLHFRKGYFNHVRIDSSRKKRIRVVWDMFRLYRVCALPLWRRHFNFYDGQLVAVTYEQCFWGLSNRIDPDRMPHMGASPQGQRRLYILNLILF